MKKGFYVLLIVSLSLLVKSCNTTDPPNGDSQALALKHEDVSCTETWITLTTNNLQLPATVTLNQTNSTGDTKSQTLNLITQDSLLYVDSLLPNQNYDFIASHSGLIGISSNELNVLTLDTISHNVSWQSFEFGEHGASFLWDVAIIDENNIWAVGEIYLNDSLGQPDPKVYNAVQWNGVEWKVKKITVLYNGNQITPPLSGIFTFSYNNIWLSAGIPINGDGMNWVQYHLFDMGVLTQDDGSINKIWGSNSDNIYFVGEKGTIVNYKLGIWKKIYTGTDSRINDVYGIESSGNNTILYCPVSSYFIPGDKKILKIVDQRVDSVSWNRNIRLNSAWASNENILYVCGESNYVNKFGKWEEISLYPGATNSVRGNGLNDIFIVGDNGSIFHFNGMSWQMLNIPNDKGYSRVTTKGNLVVICGNHLGKGLIEVGIRN